MTSSLERITAELATLLRGYSYEPEAGFFEEVLVALRETNSLPAGQREIARDILSAYGGMGSLNDLVIMVDGKADSEVNGHLEKLLRELRIVAIEVATVSSS